LTHRRTSITAHDMRLIAILLLVGATTAQAQTAPDKFVRGLAGMTTAFLEVPGNMVRETDERGAAVGLPLGFAKGLGMIVPRVLVGVWEFVSAPFPAPAGYAPILEPEYPWSYFDDAGGRGSRRRSR
jgi:putative exosortase-associated protein (TIGR04073 family)